MPTHVLDTTLQAAALQAATQADKAAQQNQGLRPRKPPVLPSQPLQTRGPPRRPIHPLLPRGIQLRLF